MPTNKLEVEAIITGAIDISKLSPGSLVLVKVPPEATHMPLARHVHESLRKWLDEHGGNALMLILLADGTSVEALNEEAMNRLGWFRQPPDFSAPKLVEMEVRADGKVAWVNVDGKCALRASQIENLVLRDARETIAQSLPKHPGSPESR